MLVVGGLLWSQLVENSSGLDVHLIRGRVDGYQNTARKEEENGWGEENKLKGGGEDKE